MLADSSEAVLMRVTRHARSRRVNKQYEVMAGVRCVLCRLLLGHLGVHCRATSSAPLAKKTPKAAAAGFMPEQLQPEEDGLSCHPTGSIRCGSFSSSSKLCCASSR